LTSIRSYVTVAVAQMAARRARPPGLLAISPVAAEDDLYREDIYPGGIKSTPGTGDFWPVFTAAVSGGRELAPVTYAQYLEHPLWDALWKQISMWTKWSRITTPILAIGGWNDTLVPGGAGELDRPRRGRQSPELPDHGPVGTRRDRDPCSAPCGRPTRVVRPLAEGAGHNTNGCSRSTERVKTARKLVKRS
jgi:predicted acyl esterase